MIIAKSVCWTIIIRLVSMSNQYKKKTLSRCVNDLVLIKNYILYSTPSKFNYTTVHSLHFLISNK